MVKRRMPSIKEWKLSKEIKHGMKVNLWILYFSLSFIDMNIYYCIVYDYDIDLCATKFYLCATNFVYHIKIGAAKDLLMKIFDSVNPELAKKGRARLTNYLFL